MYREGIRWCATGLAHSNSVMAEVRLRASQLGVEMNVDFLGQDRHLFQRRFWFWAEVCAPSEETFNEIFALLRKRLNR